jgi:uncharacterized protein (UPF0333 family)
MKKAQIAQEVLFAIGIIVLIFIILMIFTSNRKVAYYELEHNVKAASDCHNLANIMSTVYAADDGTQVNMRTDYSISIANNSVLRIDYEGQLRAMCSSYAKIPVGNYSGNLLIKKENGGLIINAA